MFLLQVSKHIHSIRFLANCSVMDALFIKSIYTYADDIQNIHNVHTYVYIHNMKQD